MAHALKHPEHQNQIALVFCVTDESPQQELPGLNIFGHGREAEMIYISSMNCTQTVRCSWMVSVSTVVS